MSDRQNPESLQREKFYQRRSVSVGDTSSPIVADDSSELPDNEEMTNYIPYIKPNDKDGYICTPLPRTNHRPTAATCWLVFLFASSLLGFPRQNARCSVSTLSPSILLFIIDKNSDLFGFDLENQSLLLPSSLYLAFCSPCLFRCTCRHVCLSTCICILEYCYLSSARNCLH